jgi:hypothetical protein
MSIQRENDLEDDRLIIVEIGTCRMDQSLDDDIDDNTE